MTDIDALLQERGNVYGDSTVFHIAVANIWSALDELRVEALGAGQLEYTDNKYANDLIDANLVALKQVAWKLARAATSPQHQDNYADMHGYAKIAERIMFPDTFSWGDTSGTVKEQPLQGQAITVSEMEHWSTESQDDFTFDIKCPNCGNEQTEMRSAKTGETVRILVTVCLGCDSLMEFQHPHGLKK